MREEPSAWSQYLRQKYGQGRSGSQRDSTSPTKQIGRSKSSHAIYDHHSDSSDDEAEQSGRSPSAMSSGRVEHLANNANLAFSFPRSM